MNLKPGIRVILTRENDKIILQPISSFTEKLAGITKQSFGKTPEEVDNYIADERKDRRE